MTKREVELIEEIENIKTDDRKNKEQTIAQHIVTSQKRSQSLGKLESELKYYKEKYEESIEKIRKLEIKNKMVGGPKSKVPQS